MKYRFERFTLDADRRQLFRGEDPIALSPKGLRLLRILLEERPKAISRNEMVDRLWPPPSTPDTDLGLLVSETRAALGDDPREPRFLKTVHGFGYSFAGSAEEEGTRSDPLPSRFRLVWGSRRYNLSEGPNVLGRSPGLDVRVVHPSVSRRHARVILDGERVIVEDLGSRNGTFHGRERIEQAAIVREGEQVRFGSVRMTLRKVPRGVTSAEVTSFR